MELAAHDICTGCGACAKACPRQAIAYGDDDEGFPTPYIQKEKCIECGICNKICPAFNKPKMKTIRAAYAAQALDREILKNSTSGGLFTVFAREIFRRNGVVFGCVWDEQYNAVIKRATNEEELKPMRGSKYVWSWAGDTFPEVRKHLEDGRAVMFVGLPCQVAGLKNYLRKDYDNLFLMDSLCSGTPSPLAFQKYLDTICVSKIRSDLNLKFRDKEPYGVGVHITYKGKIKKTLPIGEHITNPYYYSFFSHLIDRRSCYQCPYGSADRISDFTMCDYWGVSNYHKEMDVKAGVSGLMINTEKGQILLESVKKALVLIPTQVENIGKANNLILNGKSRDRKIPEIRDEFFSVLKTDGWLVAEKKYLYNKARFKQWIKLKLPATFVLCMRKIIH